MMYLHQHSSKSTEWTICSSAQAERKERTNINIINITAKGNKSKTEAKMKKKRGGKAVFIANLIEIQDSHYL